MGEYHINTKIDSARVECTGVEAEAGTLRRLAAGNRWSGGERKHDQDV